MKIQKKKYKKRTGLEAIVGVVGNKNHKQGTKERNGRAAGDETQE
jgi:23S rRNA maturation mini-RNase III